MVGWLVWNGCFLWRREIGFFLGGKFYNRVGLGRGNGVEVEVEDIVYYCI